ncbi:MAG: hypothetical protein Ta2G_00990 [Termitinemataceae bacterium]|nr:MAG: hypothetical protein Ta2G_00990 [Termitinemataceae bacterium]
MKHIKTFVLGVLFFLCVGNLSAKSTKQLELSTGAHYYTDENSLIGDTPLVTEDIAVNFGLSLVFMWRHVGFAEYCNFFFPIQRTIGGTKEFSNRDYLYAVGVDSLLAFVIKIVDKPKFKMPLALGLHVTSYITSLKDNSENQILTGLGVGGNLSFEFFPRSSFYLFLKAQASYDLFGMVDKNLLDDAGEKQEVHEVGRIQSFWISPAIGIGFSF